MRKVVPATVAAIMAVVGCCIGYAFIFLAIGILPLKVNPVYRGGMDLVNNDPAVIGLFGSPVKESLFVIGTTKGSLGGSEVVNVQVGISGPWARGTAHICGTKNGDGTCSISSIWIEIGGERVLDYRGDEPEKGVQTIR